MSGLLAKVGLPSCFGVRVGECLSVELDAGVAFRGDLVDEQIVITGSEVFVLVESARFFEKRSLISQVSTNAHVGHTGQRK